ncbi:MAG: CDP-alcohol phosphatidyltransferase family protein [Lachnospirales bacterium]
MLDTNARKFIQPIFDKNSNFFIKKKITATQVTFLALILGLISAFFLLLNLKFIALALLWLSGYFDALDGTIARKTNTKSALGGFLDIIFDRIVEISIIFVLCINNHSLAFYCVFLLGAIIMSMTIFLTSGALIEKSSKKAFYYQAGLAERTEGFVMLSLAMCFTKYSHIFLIIFAVIVAITAIQRFTETVNFLK